MRYTLICALGLIACGDKDTGDDGNTTSSFTDDDGDGYGAGADCDDSDPNTFPGADETCDGKDNDCNGTVDDSAVDGTMAYTDNDGDGFGDPDTMTVVCDVGGLSTAGTDCDDDDGAKHPDADEVCDGVDNDCDGAVDDFDDDAVGLTTFYIDRDADGYGGTDTIGACSAPLGYVELDGDCDDAEPGANPAWTEVGCDNIDNDCDGKVDSNTVPEDYSTIQAAVDALGDGSEICLQAGTHAESVDVTGRQLTFTGGGSAEDVVLDLSGESFFVFDNWDDEADMAGEDTGRIVLQGVTVTGTAAMSDGEYIEGTLLNMSGGTASIRNIVVDGLDLSIDGGRIYGGLINAVGSTVSLTSVDMSGVSVDVADTGNDDNIDVEGLLVYAYDSEVWLSNIAADGTTVSTSTEPQYLYLEGMLVKLSESSLYADAFEVTNSAADLTGSSVYSNGLVIDSYNSSIDATNLAFTDNTLNINGESSAYAYGAVKLYSGDADITWNLSTVDFSGNSLNTTCDSSSYTYGVLSQSGGLLNLDHATVWGNSTRADVSGSSTSGYGVGMLRLAGNADVSHVDVRGNSVYGDYTANGGGITAYPDDSEWFTLTNAIIAGNSVESNRDQAAGAGVYSNGNTDSTVDITNVTFFGNEIVGGETARGSAVALGLEWGTGSVVNTAIGGGSATGTTVEGTAVYIDTAENLTRWAYNNVHDSGEENIFFGIDDPTGDENGNISDDPRYDEDEDADYANWDFTYGSAGGNRNEGDPEILDADESRSDIGAYGGPGSDSW